MENTLDPSIFLTHAGDISLINLVVNILLAALLLGMLSVFYRKYGTTLTNRNHLAKNFVMIGVTTTLIITVVKASLALSLGLVGALSIVRFRAAIKEPEELSFLFLAIAVGLGFGADHKVLTIVAFFVILLVFMASTKLAKKSFEKDNVFFTISFVDKDNKIFNSIMEIITLTSPGSILKRYDQNREKSELVFLLTTPTVAVIEDMKKHIDNAGHDVEYSFVEEARVY